MSQVHEATNVLITTFSYDARTRERCLERTSRILMRTQARNDQARVSHTKTRRRRLRELNLHLTRIQSCMPP